MIKKENSQYVLYTKDGSKRLGGPYKTRAEAVEREKQVQYYKHLKGK